MAVPDVDLPSIIGSRPIHPNLILAHARAASLMQRDSSLTRYKACEQAAAECDVSMTTLYAGWDRYQASASVRKYQEMNHGK